MEGEQGTTETTEAVVENAESGITVAIETARSFTTAAASGEADLAKVREVVLRAHPDVVPELVQGGSIDELLASVEPARGAYQRVAEAVRGGQGAPAATETAEQAVQAPPSVPAGGGSNVVDPSTLGPTTKIARALAERKRRA